MASLRTLTGRENGKRQIFTFFINHIFMLIRSWYAINGRKEDWRGYSNVTHMGIHRKWSISGNLQIHDYMLDGLIMLIILGIFGDNNVIDSSNNSFCFHLHVQNIGWQFIQTFFQGSEWINCQGSFPHGPRILLITWSTFM